MQKLRVVSLSERLSASNEACVGLELDRKGEELTVGEVFDALKQYLDQHREELRQRGPESVRVSLIRSVIDGGASQWRAAHL